MAEMRRNLAKTAGEILPLLSPGKMICVFDTETTGLPKGDNVVKIIQFSGIRYRVLPDFKFEEVDFLDRYINPEEPLAPKITELTGITDEIVSKSPTEREVGPEIYQYLDEADIWAAYNANFDLARLTDMSERLRFYFEQKPCIDVLQISRDWVRKGEDVENNKLGTTYTYLYPDGAIQFHNSLADVQATTAVMEALLPKYVGTEMQTQKNIHVTKQRAWVNPNRSSQQRIRLTLDAPFPIKDGDIFYDCIAKCWSCTSSSKVKKMFASLSDADLAEIERQTLKIASNWRVYHSMDELAKDRISFLLKKQREKKKAQ